MLAGVTCAHAPESTAHGTCTHTSFWPTLLISTEDSCMLVIRLMPEWRKSGALALNPMASSMVLSVSCLATLRFALHVLSECCPNAHSGPHPGSLDLLTLSFSLKIASSNSAFQCTSGGLVSSGTVSTGGCVGVGTQICSPSSKHLQSSEHHIDSSMPCPKLPVKFIFGFLLAV